TWAFGLCGATLALSFYSYQDLYFLPILVFGYALYEACMSNDKPRFLRNTAVLFLCFLILSMPILEQIFRHSGLNLRDKELLAFPNLFLEQGFTGVWNHFLETLMVFNRRGDSWPYHNIPDHRQLDDVTGVLWLLGLFYSISRLKERKHFYPLLGFGLFLLPAFLSVDSRHASRLIGTLPFVFFLAAQVLIDFHQEIKGLKPKILPAIILSLLLFLSVAQNAWDYFQVQAKNTDCWRVCGGAEDSWVAQAIQRYSGSYTCLVCQKFYKNFQINFLDYDLAPQIGCWKLPQSLYLKGLNPRKGVCLFFQEGQWGDLKLFQDLYPGGATEWFKDLDGNPIAGFYLIPPPLWVNRSVLLGRHSLTHGLKGVYYLSAQEKGLPALIQVDPVLNFTFRNDFSIADFPPLAVHWTGSLIIPKNGIYEWTVLTTDDFQMSMDGIKVLWRGQTDHGLYLKKGNHRLEAHFLKTDGVDTILNLMWKTPGSSRFEILPAQSVKPFP
ncbi:MAG TPA: PA14 domain-containing protein, partial [bacterium]|nr:PA14 domain-containing protein [bacterium]